MRQARPAQVGSLEREKRARNQKIAHIAPERARYALVELVGTGKQLERSGRTLVSLDRSSALASQADRLGVTNAVTKQEDGAFAATVLSLGMP